MCGRGGGATRYQDQLKEVQELQDKLQVCGRGGGGRCHQVPGPAEGGAGTARQTSGVCVGGGGCHQVPGPAEGGAGTARQTSGVCVLGGGGAISCQDQLKEVQELQDKLQVGGGGGGSLSQMYQLSFLSLVYQLYL